MGAIIYANTMNYVFILITPLSHGREVAPWQILTMTAPTMSRRFGVEIEFLSTITAQQAVIAPATREAIIARPGIRHGQLNLVSAEYREQPHSHSHADGHSRSHGHYRPRS